MMTTKMYQIVYLLTLLLNLGILSLVVYAIYSIVKLVKRHFALLTDIQTQVKGIYEQMNKQNR